tara:strand:- start:540 stop:932 length:393 start_codon:yes stop_codon:yes gene_type:complete
MDFTNIDESNYIIFAMRNYSNPQCVNVGEFNEDINRIKYLKKLFKRYYDSGELKERLILNHLIIFYNVFENEAATRLLFLRLETEFYSILKTFLVFLTKMPFEVIGIDGTNVSSYMIRIDENIKQVLERI